MGRNSRYCNTEVLPFASMVVVEYCANVGRSTLFKVASLKGMSYLVFIVYSFGISAVALVPLAFIFHRKTQLPPFNLSIFGRLVLLAILGFSAQMFYYKGIDYSSPTLSSAMSNLTPAFTYALALIFRMEKLIIRSPRSQAKILGTIVSISGALVVVLYDGPAVIRTSSSTDSLPESLKSAKSDWIIGGIFFAANYLLLSMWYTLQAQTVRLYPAELLLVVLYNIGVTIISAPVCYYMEPDTSSWSIGTKIMLITLLYAGLVSSSFGTVVHTWGLLMKGPVYVALFGPLSIAIAVVMGVIFLGDTLYLGSVIGAIVISIGFYVVMWGKAKDRETEESPSAEDVPLLQ